MKKIQLSNFIFPVLIMASVAAKAQPQLVGPFVSGGSQNGGGIFRLDQPANTPGVIREFNNLNPHLPSGGVCAGDEDWLYGMVTYNGTNNEGAAYRIRKDGTGFVKLFDLGTGTTAVGTPYYHTDGRIYFNAGNTIKIFDPGTMGVSEVGALGLVYSKNLLIDSDDYIYYLGFQRLYKVKTDGTDLEELHVFDQLTEGIDGTAGLTEDASGTLYGLQKTGGTDNGGTIFSIQKDGTGFTVLHHFTNATGYNPESKLELFDSKLYGTTSRGGNSDIGVLYTINPDGSDYRVLRHFEISSGPLPDPLGNIRISAEGRIFGCYSQFHLGPTFETTRLWKIDTSGSNLENFINVDQRNNGHGNIDILLTNDSIFLTTSGMGRHDGGVLSLCDTSSFAAMPLHHFGASANGFNPRSGLIKATDARLYGTNNIGGPDGNGVVFSINADGTGFSKLHEFTDAEGYDPRGKLLEASNGKIYGVLHIGGPGNTGCLFRMDKNGANFQVVYNFADLNNGYFPEGGVIEGPGGILYGSFAQSSNGSGLYRINLDGTGYTVLKFFASGELAGPMGGLRLYRGYLYGVCQTGGTFSGGVFRIRPDGSGYQQLHVFNQTDGAFPRYALTIANGRLFGTTDQGGANSYGVLFGIDTSGTNFTVHRDFDFSVDGASPQETTLASDGLLYGVTATSNINPGGGGTLFRINPDGSGFTTVYEFNLVTQASFPVSVMDLNSSPLPVQWVDFTARKKDQSVLLEWQTAQEQNADQFIVERSNTNTAFQLIGMVTATGNTATGARYSFIDQDPLNGDNYYRLKQTDKDGKFTYSKVVRINFEQQVLFTISPNPAQDNLTIKLSAGERVEAVVITDASGRLVKRQGGFNASTAIIPITGLSKGMYWLQVETGQKNYRTKFMKL
jgi:uncharacterized repeat protein (TIGR03803 family)